MGRTLVLFTITVFDPLNMNNFIFMLLRGKVSGLTEGALGQPGSAGWGQHM